MILIWVHVIMEIPKGIIEDSCKFNVGNQVTKLGISKEETIHCQLDKGKR